MAIDFNDVLMNPEEGTNVILASGVPGTTPSFSIGTVEEVAPGNTDVTMSGTLTNPVLNFKLARGAAGGEQINDNAGDGDTDFVWSASKVFNEIKKTFAGLYSDTTAIPANADLNDYTEVGNYRLSSNTTTIQNFIPNPATGRLYVIKPNSNTAVLQVYLTSYGKLYIRRVVVNTPSSNTAWVCLLDTSVIDDTKGDGDTGYVWSADKSYDEIHSLDEAKLDKTAVDDTKGDGDTDYVWSADKSYDEINALNSAKLDKADLSGKTFVGYSSDTTPISANADLNSFTTPGNFRLTSNASTIQNFIPNPELGRLFVFQSVTDYALIQMFVTTYGRIYIRRLGTGAYSETTTEWEEITATGFVSNYVDADIIPANADMNDYTTPGNYRISNNISTILHFIPSPATGRLFVFQPNSSQGLLQMFITSYGKVYVRRVVPTDTTQNTEWERFIDSDAVRDIIPTRTFAGYSSDTTAIPANADLDDYITSGNFRLTSNVSTIQNMPIQTTGRLYVFESVAGYALIQVYITSGTSRIFARRVTTDQTTYAPNTAWVELTDYNHSNKKMYSIGNSFLNGYVYNDHTLTEIASFRDVIWGQIAMALGVSEGNVDHIMHASTGLVQPVQGHDDHRTVILSTDLSDYDYLLTHINIADIKNHLIGTVDADGTGTTIADGVVQICNYLHDNKYMAKLIILGVPGYDVERAGDDVFTSTYSNGNSIDALDDVMFDLAVKYHFIYVSWQDMELWYHYLDFADYIEGDTGSEHAASVEFVRACGNYAAMQIMATNSPIALGKIMNSLSS